jgi:hypothetical protein
MTLDKSDVKIEQKVEKEERKELVELNEASKLVWAVSQGIAHLRDNPFQREFTYREYEGKWRRKLEDASRLIGDARMHNQRVRKLSERVYNDIRDIRGGGKDKNLLTRNEAFILGQCGNLKHKLDEARAVVEQAIAGVGSFKISDLGQAADRAYKAIVEIIEKLRELYVIEQQVEVSTEKYLGT